MRIVRGRYAAKWWALCAVAFASHDAGVGVQEVWSCSRPATGQGSGAAMIHYHRLSYIISRLATRALNEKMAAYHHAWLRAFYLREYFRAKASETLSKTLIETSWGRYLRIARQRHCPVCWLPIDDDDVLVKVPGFSGERCRECCDRLSAALTVDADDNTPARQPAGY
jgi:hypothetical protein